MLEDTNSRVRETHDAFLEHAGEQARHGVVIEDTNARVRETEKALRERIEELTRTVEDMRKTNSSGTCSNSIILYFRSYM